MPNSCIKALLCLGLVLLLVGTVAADELPVVLNGGGPSTWQVTNSGGTNNGLPTGTSDFSAGLTVDNVTLGTQDDAFDNGLTVWVDNQIFALPEPADAPVAGSTLTAGPVLMSGLNVTVQHHAVSSSAVLRTLVTFTNPTAADISAAVAIVSNVGSDGTTAVNGSSSGDTAFTAVDRWLVTSDSVPSNDVTNTFVLFGPGAPGPASVAATGFSDGGDANGVTATFNITVPAGATRSLMFFHQVSATPADALASAAQFNEAPLLTSDLMAGLTQEQADQILNWQFGAVTGLSIVVRGTDNGIYHNRFNGSAWVGFSALPGATNDSPALVANGAMLELVVRGTDNGIYHNRFDGTTWLGWSVVGGSTNDAPALVVNGANLDLVVRGTDNGIYHNRFDGTAWLGWTALPGTTSGVPALVANGANLDLVVRGTDNSIYHNRFDGTSWGAWTVVGGATPDDPALSAFGDGTLDLAVRGTDNGIYHNRFDGTTWTGWTSVPGATSSGPSLAVDSGIVHMIVRGTDNGIYHNQLDPAAGTGWQGFVNITGATPSQVSVAVH
jgi:hypothetical protein